MKNLLGVISLLLIASLTTVAQWEPVNSGLTTYRFHRNEGVLVSPDIECAKLYSGPDTTYSILGCVPSGTTGGVFEQPVNSFWRAGFSNGMSGWVNSKDITHPLQKVRCLSTNGTTLFAGTAYNSFRSTDNGNSWTQMNRSWIIPYSDYWNIHSFSFSGTDIFARGSYGVYLSIDNGENWMETGGMYNQLYLHFLAASRTCLFAISLKDVGMRSTNNGVNWDTLTYPGALALIDTNLFAQHKDGQIDLSTDNGSTWTTVHPGTSYYTSAGYFCSSGRYLFDMDTGDGTHNHIRRKLWTDSGLVFDDNMNFPPSYVQASAIGKIAANGETVLLEYGKTFISTNSGADWEEITLPPDVSFPGPFVIQGSNLFVGGTGIWRRSLEVPLPIQLASFEVRRNGDSEMQLIWTTVSEIMNYGFEVQRSADGKIFTTIAGSFVAGHGTTNESHTYTYIDADHSGAISYRLRQIDLNGSVHYSEAVRLGATTDVKEVKPMEFGLGQNYPNPFNPTTTIGYTVGGARDQASGLSDVKLSVYDLLGREVAVLMNEKKSPGSYEVKFNASALASGLYLYRLTAGSFVQTRKLMVLR